MPDAMVDPTERNAAERALDYMGLAAGTPMKQVPVDTVFIGSCTNGRIEDLRAVAEVAKGRKVSINRAMIVPGSFKVKEQAVAEGLDVIFTDRSEEHTSELQSLMRISYAVFCLKQKKI